MLNTTHLFRSVRCLVVIASLLAVSSHASAQSGTRGSVPSIAPSPSYSQPPASFLAPQASYQQAAPIGQISPQYASPSFSTMQPYAAPQQYYAPAPTYMAAPPAYYYRPAYRSQPVYRGYGLPKQPTDIQIVVFATLSMIHDTMLMQNFIILVAFGALATASNGVAGTNVYVGQQRVVQSDSMNSIDHLLLNQLLAKYVDNDGAVNYRDWKASSDDREQLASYLNRLSVADPQIAATREATLAFWINAYNAVTIEGILRVYPTSSIRNHTAKVFGYNIWDDLQLYVGGVPYSLNQNEHEILRKLDEPRIHFAIVCASKSCPQLLNQAYLADRIDNQLQTNAKRFFSQKANFSVAGSTLTLSPILDWFNADFGDTNEKLLMRISEWLPETHRQSLRGKSFAIRYSEYDWSINEQASSE